MAATNIPPTILICGIPGTGKSEFAKWLAREKGFVHLDIDHSVLNGVEGAWNAMFTQAGGVRVFVQALRRLKAPVVIDWGFPLHCLPIVQALRNEGIELWWFDGDRDAARQEFLKRADVSVDALNAQMQAIESKWPQITALVGSHTVNSVGAGPSHPPFEETYRTLFGPNTRAK